MTLADNVLETLAEVRALRADMRMLAEVARLTRERDAAMDELRRLEHQLSATGRNVLAEYARQTITAIETGAIHADA